MVTLFDALKGNKYPGRGIFMGIAGGGENAVLAYFIMGRSKNSRNRIFVEEGTGIRTKAFDESKVTDPSLIIYSPVKVLGNKTIVTNGDQTETIYDGMDRQLTFEQSLRSRTFEPDAPNYTPRISGVMRTGLASFSGEKKQCAAGGKSDGAFARGSCNYALSIIKKCGDGVQRIMFAYENPNAGEGRLIHTYMGDGDPLISFEGEPARVSILYGANGAIPIDNFTQSLWQSLDNDNKVSLWVRYINLATGQTDSRIVNKNGD